MAKLVGCDLLTGNLKKGKFAKEYSQHKYCNVEYEVVSLDGFTIKLFENQRRQRESDGAVNARFFFIGKLAAPS